VIPAPASCAPCSRWSCSQLLGIMIPAPGGPLPYSIPHVTSLSWTGSVFFTLQGGAGGTVVNCRVNLPEHNVDTQPHQRTYHIQEPMRRARSCLAATVTCVLHQTLSKGHINESSRRARRVFPLNKQPPRNEPSHGVHFNVYITH
jgi:hypothetical protein